MKILIGFLSAHHNSRAVHVHAQRARMKNSPIDYKFVFGNPLTQTEPCMNRYPLEDELRFDNVDDRKEFLVDKDKALFKYALDNGYDFCFRACDDTIVYPERILQNLELLAQHDYAGTMCGYGMLPGQGIFTLKYLDYMHGGVGIWLSKKAMEMLLADNWKGPWSSPYSKQIELTPGHFFKGSWNIYWDDLWIGEVLKGNLNYNDPRRDAIYQNFLVSVLDSPELFASNNPFDKDKVIATHSLDQMGTSDLQPCTFSTLTGTLKIVGVDWTQAASTFHAVTP